MRILLILVAVCLTGPVYAREAAVIIYANDLPKWNIDEIINHEMGHLNCRNWKHPKGSQANGKAWPPPTRCLRRTFKGRIYPTPVSSFEARARCKGIRGSEMLGCSTIIEEN